LNKKIVAVTGGKGGTGKSFVATNLAVLLAEYYSLVLADLDVEAPNDHILLGAGLSEEEPVDIMFPFIDYSKCIKCRACSNVCDTGAMLTSREGLPYIIPRLCSGCKSCYFVCPTRAIYMGRRIIGKTFKTNVNFNGSSFTLVTGMLNEGEEHTPPVVLRAKRRALSLDADLYLVDTSAGTSNTVATAMDKSMLVIAVTEPTPLGLHDLDLILHVADSMDIPEKWVVINKSGIGPEEKHQEIAEKHNAEIVARIPYSKDVIDSYVKGTPIAVANPHSEISSIFRQLAEMVREVIG